MIFDPDIAGVIDAEKFHSKCKNSPFDGKPVQGRVLKTVRGGRVVYAHDAEEAPSRARLPMPDPLGSFAYTWPFYAAGVFGYLLGSIPFGLILTKLAGLGDIRAIGSGNIGATNVLRTGNKKLAVATLILDGAKGAVAVLIAGIYGTDIAVLAAGGAMLGHCFPVWLKFKGGKGVATGLVSCSPCRRWSV